MPIVLLDANVWIKERLLRSAIGAAFLHATGGLGFKIALPDFTWSEITAGILTTVKKAESDVQNGLSTIQAITGSKPNITLPTEQEMIAACEQRADELKHRLIRVQRSSEQMDRALRRVLEKKTPSAKKEQFRDSLFWEVALDLAQGDDLYFVTADDDFTDVQAGRRALAASLRDEVAAATHVVTFASDLAELLRVLIPGIPPLDEDAVLRAIDLALKPYIEDVERHTGVTFSAITWKRVDAFVTERVDILAVQFRVNYGAMLPFQFDTPSETDSKVLVVGECLYNTRSKDIARLQLDRIHVPVTSSGGPGGMTFLSSTSSYDARTIPYSLRRQLPLKTDEE